VFTLAGAMVNYYFGLGLVLRVRVRVRVTVRDSFRFRVRNRMPMFAITPAKLHVTRSRSWKGVSSYPASGLAS